MLSLRTIHLALVALTPLCASGQAFNVDFGKNSFQAPMPSITYGAAANQPGFWNSDYAGNVPLLDTTGAATSAFVFSGSLAETTTPIGGGDSDEERLMGDASRWSADFSNTQVANLLPGQYRLYVYGWAGSREGNFQSVINVGIEGTSSSAFLTINYKAQWPGQQVLGETYATWDFTITKPNSNIGIYPQNLGTILQPRYSYVNGIQIVPIPTPGAAGLLTFAALGAARRRL